MNKISTVIAATVISITTSQYAIASNVNGRLHVSTKLHVGAIQAAEKSSLRLGAVKLNNSSIGSNLNINSIAVVGGNLKLDKGAQVRIASLDLLNAEIDGGATLQMSVSVGKGITAGRNSDIGLGGVQVSGKSNNISVDHDESGRGVRGGIEEANKIMPVNPISNVVKPALPLAKRVSDINGGLIPFDQLYPEGYKFENIGVLGYDEKGNKIWDLRGECAWFAEEITRLPDGRKWNIGNTVAQKKGKLANYVATNDGYYKGDAKPEVGHTIIFNTGTYGHVAVINEILPDGKVRLTESNYPSGHSVSHDRVVDLSDSNIEGFLRTVPTGVAKVASR